MKIKAIRICENILLIIFGIILCYMLFHNLDKGYLIQTDEAYHATNAYEMYKQGNWIVNTYRYAADYFNSKPPLCLDLMQLSYRIFGIIAFAARFPSALAGLFTCAIIVIFSLQKRYSLCSIISGTVLCQSGFLYFSYVQGCRDGRIL